MVRTTILIVNNASRCIVYRTTVITVCVRSAIHYITNIGYVHAYSIDFQIHFSGESRNFVRQSYSGTNPFHLICFIIYTSLSIFRFNFCCSTVPPEYKHCLASQSNPYLRIMLSVATELLAGLLCHSCLCFMFHR